MEYDVFARMVRGERLSHIGTVSAPNGSLAKVYARYIYDEEKWAELCVVERRCLDWVWQVTGTTEEEEGIPVGKSE